MSITGQPASVALALILTRTLTLMPTLTVTKCCPVQCDSSCQAKIAKVHYRAVVVPYDASRDSALRQR
jgi:hypothetical protein